MDALIFLCLLPFGALMWIVLIGLGWVTLADWIRSRRGIHDNDDCGV